MTYNRAMHLHQVIPSKVNAWREADYPSPDYPAIAEILEFATIPQDDGGVQLRVLRAAQLRALETYWYLRLVEVRIPDWRSMLVMCGLLDQTNRQRLASMQDWCILCLLD